jgi:hypothetical protein
MDGTLTLQRMSTALDSRFSGLIDLSDVAHMSEDEQRNYFLTRALAAFCITTLTDADPKEASKSITDGFKDQGIDAIYFDSTEKTLYLIPTCAS